MTDDKKPLKKIDPKKKCDIDMVDGKHESRMHTRGELREACESRMDIIEREFQDSFEFISSYPKSVTFFGSARFEPGHEYYEKARSIAKKLCREGFTIVTGGGPGIMEGANKGASEACGISVGLNIELPNEQSINQYVTHGLSYHYFFSRKVALAFSAEAYLYFPGGFGTLDEFFEIATLVQTKKIERVPIILVGTDYWGDLQKFIDKTLFNEFKTIDETDMQLYVITDDEDTVIDLVKNAPMRNE